MLWAALYESEPFVPILAFTPELPRALQRASVPEKTPAAPSIAIHDPAPDRAAVRIRRDHGKFDPRHLQQRAPERV